MTNTNSATVSTINRTGIQNWGSSSAFLSDLSNSAVSEPTAIFVVPVKLFPVIVTTVPAGPLSGVNEVIVGRTRSVSPALVPAGVVITGSAQSSLMRFIDLQGLYLSLDNFAAQVDAA